MSGNTGQSFHILPKEAGDGYNPRNTPIGSGPWSLSEQVPSSRMTFKRNPGWRPRVAFRRVSLSQALVVSQIVISLLMLVAAGLFARTLSCNLSKWDSIASTC